MRATAGRGLPTIEPGMPLPAGTGLTRRKFVARSLGLALSVYGAGRLQLFDEGIANAATGEHSPILVSVFLQGGADSLSLLYPEGDPLYQKLRTELAVTGGTQFTEDPRLYWNPALSPLSQLHDEGKVTVLPAIGYDHPDQSHFTSRHYWEVGATDPAPAHRLARPLPRRRRRRRQPAAGSLDHRQPRALARDRQGAGGGDRRPEPVQLRRAGRLGKRRRTACSTRWARSAACTRTTPRSARPRT